MRLLSKGIVLATITCMALPAFAATLQPLQGGILVNRGRGFREAYGPTQVYAGDVVMANPNGTGELVYDDGCRVRVDPGAVVTVQEVSPCQTGANWTPYVVAGAVVAGAVTAAVLLSQHHGNNQAPPLPPPQPASP